MRADGENWLSDNNNRAAAQAESWVPTDKHTVRLLVIENKVSVFIDGYCVYSSTAPNKKGYIFFASKALTTRIYQPTVIEYPDLESYYSANMKTTDPSSETFNTRWSLTSNGIKRNDNGTDWGGNGNCVSLMYLNNKSYKSFELEYDYLQSHNNEPISFVGFGAQKGVTYANNSTEYAYAVSLDYGRFVSAKNVGEWLGSDCVLEKTGSWTGSGITHKIKIRVHNNCYSLSIDGNVLNSGTLTNYNGGYVYIGSQAFISTFSNIKIVELPDDTLNISNFNSYYSSDISSSELSSVPFADYWYLFDENTTVKRTTKDSNWAQDCKSNMATLFYNVKEYENFDMTVKFSNPANNISAFFGFGADMGKSWWNDSSVSVYTFHANSGGILEGKTCNWITGGGCTPQDKLSGWNIESLHTLRVKVVNKAITFWIDGLEVGTTSNANYKGGYIFFAGDDMTTRWSEPIITEIDAINPDDFSTYYAANAKTAEDMTSVPTLSYWNANENTLVRNDNGINRNNSYEGLSVLYVKAKKYKSFEMTVDYRVCQTSNNPGRHNNSALVGFGATEIGKSFYYDANTVTRNLSLFGAICNADTSDPNYWYKPSGTTLADKYGSDWKKYDKHTLKLVVKDGIAKYYIDDILVYGFSSTNYKEAGYIYFASNETTTYFGKPVIKELSDTDPSSYSSSPLYRKKALFIGDSISHGALDDAFGVAWGGRIGIKYGMNWTNKSVSGSAVTSTEQYPYIENQLVDGNFDYILVEGGINDAMNRLPIGEITLGYDVDNYDVKTFAGALEHLFSSILYKYRNAKVGFIVTFKALTASDDDADTYYAVARQICDKWGIKYLDLYNDKDCDIWFNTAGDLTYIPDSLHPSAAGYDLLLPKIESFMETTMDKPINYDLTGDQKVNATDLVEVRKAILGISSVSYDFNGDNRCNILDLIKFKKVVLGLES